MGSSRSASAPASSFRFALRSGAAACFGLFVSSSGTAVASAAAISTDDPDEIIVTGIRPHPLLAVPKSVTVITAADIAASPTINLVDLLAREANVNLRSVTGNDKFAGIDIRGMGDTSVSNVLVLVDGVRLNPPDLAGPDLASLALDQIDRIEIVRGANAVRYGSGAVGGVVNIITRARGSGASFAASLGGGSYREAQAAGSVTVGGARSSATLRLSAYETDGYRQNGELERHDGEFRLATRVFGQLDVGAGVQWHSDEYGLPGPVSAEAFEQSAAARRASNAPDDGGESDDLRYRLDLGWDLGAGRRIAFLGAYRDWENRYVIGYTPLLAVEEQEDVITGETATAELTYRLPLTGLAGEGAGPPELDFGISAATTDYRRQEDGSGNAGRSSALDGKVDDAGIYAAVSWQVAPSWRVSAGQRWNGTDTRSSRTSLVEVCDYDTVPGIPMPVPVNCRSQKVVSGVEGDRWDNSATDAGLVWTPGPELDVYFAFSRAFRIPNIDELSLSAGQLEPQRSSHWDAGIRQRLSGGIDVTVGIFAQKTEQEILYGIDPDTGESVNRNADESTWRRGVEAEIRWQIATPVAVLANVGYTRARFAESDAPVPLVPEWTAAASLQWRLLESLLATVGWRYVGSRTDGNDLAGSTYPKLPSYRLADCKLTWEHAAYRISMSINNLFDEVATASAYSGAVYPLPTRTFHAGVSVTF